MAKRKPQQSRVLLVSLDELKRINNAGINPSFSFALHGLYAVHTNVKKCKAVLHRA